MHGSAREILAVRARSAAGNPERMLGEGPPPAPAGLKPEDLAGNSAYWARVAAAYDIDRDVIPLDNGNWGVPLRPVMRVYQEKLHFVSKQNSYWQRRIFPDDLQLILGKTADLLGVSPDEIVFTRNATEALHTLIGGYGRLRPGDQVVYADHDYDSAIAAMKWLQHRRGVEPVCIRLPEPASRSAIIDAYAKVLEQHPRIRLMLLTHLGHRSGLVIPVSEIAQLARAKGVDVIVDAAQSFGQIDFTLPDLKADFVGLNLHKWVGAPLGVGVAYIKRDRIEDIEPAIGATGADVSGIAARSYSGAIDWAAQMTVPTAISFHTEIGVANKAARLQYLRDLWVGEVGSIPGIEILTPSDRSMYAGITSFRIRGRTTAANNLALAERLLNEHGVFTVPRAGLAGGACIRVAPALFTSEDDVIKLANAVSALAQ